MFQYFVQMLDSLSPQDDQRVQMVSVVAADDDQAREVARGLFKGNRWIPRDAWIPVPASECPF